MKNSAQLDAKEDSVRFHDGGADKLSHRRHTVAGRSLLREATSQQSIKEVVKNCAVRAPDCDLQAACRWRPEAWVAREISSMGPAVPQPAWSWPALRRDG